jgi:hypothetical protein
MLREAASVVLAEFMVWATVSMPSIGQGVHAGIKG